MSLIGNMSATQKLRGKINKVDVIYSDAYKIAVENGFEGTVEEWLESIKGPKGDDGYTPKKGVDYFDGQNGLNGKNGENGEDGTSVTVISVEESTEDGGVNIVTFSDGTVLRIKNGATGSGANITVDDILSDKSENPVQNKAVVEGFKTYWNNTVVALNQRQLKLVSGKNIKTINGESILGEGDIAVESGGVSSWNDLTDKPFYEESETLTLDFNNLPEVSVNIDEGLTVYKVSELTPPVDRIVPTSVNVTGILADGTEGTHTFNDFEYAGQETPIPEISIFAVFNNDFQFQVFIVHRAGDFTTDGVTVTFPEKGMYVDVFANTEIISEIKTAELSVVINKPLDNKYLDILEKSAEVDIFAEQEITPEYNSYYQAYVKIFSENSTLLTVGEEYKVLWEGELYTCVAFPYEAQNSTMIGNTLLATGEDNGIPFSVGSHNTTGTLVIGALDGEPKTIRIYQDGTDQIKEEYIPDSLYEKIDEKQDVILIPASVDMSGYDSGTIVETFADGSTKTTTIEFDADGNPTKITDGDGNVTTYTW